MAVKYYRDINELPLYLKTDQCAFVLQVSVASVTNYLKSGLLKGTKVGGQWRINKYDLAELMKAKGIE